MCSIRYFRLAYHNLVAAKRDFKDYEYDELFLRDAAYNLQQGVEKALKAFLECVGVTVPNTHKIGKLLKMSKDNGSAIIITEWIKEHSERLEAWEAESRYDLDFCVELDTIQNAIIEVEKFFNLNGLTYKKDAEITDDVETRLRDLIPVTINDTLELNIYYHVFKNKLKSLKDMNLFN